MVFNPNKYRPSASKCVPVILLLDTSGSMDGEKINSLYDAVQNMVDAFIAQRVKEINIKTCIITFGSNVILNNPCTASEPYIDVNEMHKSGIEKFQAHGMTPMGLALQCAKDIIEDKDCTPGVWWTPVVVLVSDGQPNDEWRKPLNSFINEGRSQKCQRIVVAIGNDADIDILTQFAESQSMVFKADEAKDIVEAFKKVTMSVTHSIVKYSQSIQAGVSNRPSMSKPSAIRDSLAGRKAKYPSHDSFYIDEYDEDEDLL